MVEASTFALESRKTIISAPSPRMQSMWRSCSSENGRGYEKEGREYTGNMLPFF